MSFLKISDPAKRDLMVKEYLELKKNIWGNLLSERTGEQQLQADLSKFYRPITETQKATTKEITEGLNPIREGIEKLPQAITFPPTQPIREASGEEEEYEEDELIGEIAKKYLNIRVPDTTFGIHKIDDHHYIGDMHVIVYKNNTIVGDEKFKSTPGLWELLAERHPNEANYNEEDKYSYGRLMVKTHALHQNNDPKDPNPKSSGGVKWKRLLSKIWKNRREYEGSGVIVIPSDPNTLLERLDLLFASQEAGHTGVGNELVSICDELKRQGVLDTNAYKKLNSLIKI